MGCANGKEEQASHGAAAAASSGGAAQSAAPRQAPPVGAAPAAGEGVTHAQLAGSAAEVLASAKDLNLTDLVEPNSVFDDYDVMKDKVLGRGNYSTVLLAHKKGTKTPYAIKVIKESSLTHEDREALKIETAILKSMDSPNIIKLYGFYEEKRERCFYIVTEFVGGGELFDRIIAKEFYSEEDARVLVRTIAEALRYCHDRGVVHRDLKPENILLTSKDDDSSIKIADFGFAKQYDTSSDDALSTSCGTPGYVAPEILNGKKYGKEVDMWSFGVIIYILLCGYPPFHSENQKELFKQIRSGDYTFDEEYWSDVSQEAKQLIRSLLVVDREKRLSIEKLLEHPWLNKEAKNTQLAGVKPKLQSLVARRRLKAGVNAVIAQNRMAILVRGKSNIGTTATSTDQGQDSGTSAKTQNGTNQEVGAAAPPVAVDAEPAKAVEAVPVAAAPPAAPSAPETAENMQIESQ